MKIIITSGGTSEAIDQVRKITNSSSGKLGRIIAERLLKEREDIEKIYYICSKKACKPQDSRVEIIEIEGTMDVKREVERLLTEEKIDYFIHAMAISDYRVDYVSTASLLSEEIREHPEEEIETIIQNNTRVIKAPKISSNEENLILLLKPTPKIIHLIKERSPQTYLVGFKLLDGVSKEYLIEVAAKLLRKNDCNLVVANDLSSIRKGVHECYIIDRENHVIEATGKEDIAKKLIHKMWNE